MVIDEFYFHRRRGLPLWERVGHPADTLSVLACFLFVLNTPLTKSSLLIYSVMCIFSCLLVTKDEFVHQSICPAGEHWLHSILFILHPISFLAVYFIWSELPALRPVVWVQTGLVGTFALYQIIYWNILWKKSPA
jgi:hypothetical protein